MDLNADAGTLPSHATVGGCVPERELSLSSARGQTESGSTILLQLLEFKTHLLEAVEELHIRRALPLSESRFVVMSLSGRREVEKRGDVRIVPDIPEQDAETRFEDQISKLVLEKQELEWAKESLQHQTETAANQHTESLIAVRKQFQAKIRNIEEEKGKYQVSAELKDREINNLKEELKSLQLLKYNLEKKSSELEQKLALQSRSKDSHLNQLGEVEKRFSALSRQCAMVKQAHGKLEQNVDEAIKRNKKLTSANEKQEATIVSLKKELEEVSNNLIKAKMSAVRHDKSGSPTGREQRIQQLHQKLNMEAEMNKKLREENVAVRAEKQEVMKSLQHTQQLLLSQTQTVSRVELELQTQREQCQALKQEHEVMREKSKATEDKVVQLMESYAASKTSWDKEKRTFLERVRSEQLGLQAVSEAYGELHQTHTELSSQAEAQAWHLYELQRRDSSQILSVSTRLYATLDIRGGETLNEPISSSETPGFGCLQSLASAQTKKPDRLEDAGAETKLVTTGATGGQHASDHHPGSQLKHTLINPSNASNSKHINLRSVLGTSGGDTSILNNCINSSNTHDRATYSDLIHTTSSESADGLLICKGSLASSPSYRSSNGCVDPHSKKKSDGGISEREQGWKDGVKPGGNTREEEKGNEEPRWNGEEVQGEHVKEGGSVVEKRGMLMAQTTDRADRLEDSQRSTKDAGDTKQSKTETKDRAGGEGADGVEEGQMERGKTGPRTPETKIPAQTATDTATEKSNTRQVIDFMETEPPLAACEPSDSSQSHSQKVSEEVADSSHVNNGCEIRGVVNSCCSDEHQSVSHGPDSVFPHLRPEEDQTFAQDLDHQVVDQTTGEKPADIPTELCSPQTHTAALTAHSDDKVCIQGLDTTATQAQPCNPFGIITNIKQAEETCDTHMREDCISVSMMFEPQALPQTQELSEQECGQLTSLMTDDDDSSAYKKEECQSDVDTCENDAQGPVETSDLKDACVDIMMDAVDLKSGLGAGSCQEHVEKDKGENAGDAKTTQTVIHPIPEIDASPETSRVKCHEPSPAGEDTSESSLHSSKKYRSSFDWASTQRITGCTVSERNTGELLRQPSGTIPTFLKSKHSRVPSVITGTSDLLYASSVCGTAPSSRRHQQAEWRAIGGTCRETAMADTESRASLSFSTSSITERRLSWQTTPGCSRAPTSVVGPGLESFWEASCSQETEDQQSSLRAQISKIEQFLSAERLRLPKRRKTEN